MSRKKVVMSDGNAYEFWSLSPLMAKDERVQASLAFLQDHTEGDALNRIKSEIELRERDAARIEKLIPFTMKIFDAAQNDNERNEAFKALKEFSSKASGISERIIALNEKSYSIIDQANKESRFVVTWMLTQEPNNLPLEVAESVVTPMNCIEPVMVILGFDQGEAASVPAPLEPTSTS